MVAIGRCVALAAVVILGGCNSAVFVAGGLAGNASLAGTTGVTEADRADLRGGRIDSVRARLEATPQLSSQQTALLCDILVKYGEFTAAAACLDGIAAAGGSGFNPTALAGKRALVALALGNSEQAARLTASGTDVGSRYVHALALARMGDNHAAQQTAQDFALKFEPRTVFYAASLYSATGDHPAALALLEDPERRLLRDYGLVEQTTIVGRVIPAPFHLDPFDEFSFGWFDDFSYAPAANVYVTFLAAHSALEVGRLEDARALFDALVAWPQLRFYRDVAWLVYYDLGRLALRRGDDRDVRRYYASSIEVVESMRRSISSDQGRIGFVAEKAAVYGAMIDFLAHKGEAEAALEYAERARSRALVDMLASRDSLAPRELPTAEAGERLRELSQAEGAAEVASALPPAQAATVAERATSQRARLASAAPSLAPLLSVQPLDLPALRNSIGADETAIAYFRTDSGWIAFVLTRTELYLVPLQASTMNRDVVALRETIQASHSDTDAWIEPAKRLHAVLLAPVLPLVHTRRLVIVPFGGLHYLPFAVLHDGTATLVQHYALRIVPSLTAIVTAAQNRHTGDGSLVIGNPDRRADAPALPNAEQEAVRVSRLLPAPELLLGSQATLNSFLTMAPRRAFVHVAGHGAFDAGAPLASRLLLTAGPGNNGDLTVAQLFEMRLSADLVTLSACQTALSKVESGDDVVGLVQGFLFAGARNVVASLWDVADAATSDLMASFYSNLRQSGSVPEALRTAQLSTMRAYPNPFYWAAFEAMSFTPIVEFRL